jgi:hypothetical protein
MGVDGDGLSIVVDSSSSFHRVPLYQRYRWELMDSQDLDGALCFTLLTEVKPDRVLIDSEDGSEAPSLSGKDASSSKSPPYVSKWTDCSVKFRLPYSSMVSYKSYHEASS